MQHKSNDSSFYLFNHYFENKDANNFVIFTEH